MSIHTVHKQFIIVAFLGAWLIWPLSFAENQFVLFCSLSEVKELEVTHSLCGALPCCLLHSLASERENEALKHVHTGSNALTHTHSLFAPCKAFNVSNEYL